MKPILKIIGILVILVIALFLSGVVYIIDETKQVEIKLLPE